MWLCAKFPASNPTLWRHGSLKNQFSRKTPRPALGCCPPPTGQRVQAQGKKGSPSTPHSPAPLGPFPLPGKEVESPPSLLPFLMTARPEMLHVVPICVLRMSLCKALKLFGTKRMPWHIRPLPGVALVELAVLSFQRATPLTCKQLSSLFKKTVFKPALHAARLRALVSSCAVPHSSEGSRGCGQAGYVPALWAALAFTVLPVTAWKVLPDPGVFAFSFSRCWYHMALAAEPQACWRGSLVISATPKENMS